MITPNPQDRKLTPQVIISSRLADQMGALAQVYYLARWFDSIDAVGRAKAGSGKSEFTIDIAATILGRSPGTVRKNLYAAHRLGYFRNISITNGHVILWYSSEANIAYRMGMEDGLGAIARIDLHRLKDLKAALTEAQAEAIQTKSNCAAKKACSDKGDLFVTSVEDVFDIGKNDPDDSAYSRGQSQIIHRGNRLTYVSRTFVKWGASQATIANSLGRSERTVRRRLKDTAKTQLAIATDHEAADWKAIARELRDGGHYQLAYDAARMCRWDDISYERYCNIYWTNHELVRQRHKRKRLKLKFETNFIYSKPRSVLNPSTAFSI